MHDHFIIVYSFFAMIFGLGFCMKPFIEVNFYLRPLQDRCDFPHSARTAFFGQWRPLPVPLPNRCHLIGSGGLGSEDRCQTAATLAAVRHRFSMTVRVLRSNDAVLLCLLYIYILFGPSSFFVSKNSDLRERDSSQEREAPKNSPLLNQTTSHVHLASS